MDQQNLSNSSSLSPIGQLFSESWNTFTKSILQLLLLGVLTFVISFFVGAAAVVIIIITGVGSAILQKGVIGAPQFTPATLTSLGIIGIIFFFIFLLVGAALQITAILIVDDNGQGSLIAKFKKSFRFIIPLFLINLVTGFLVMGGFFLFIIPGIVLAILFSFVRLEVILNNQTSLFSLKRSVSIISKNFGGIFVRLLLLFLINIGLFLVLSIFSNLIGEGNKELAGILYLIINVGMGWFSQAFTINLYKQARATVNDNQVSNIGWIWIVSLLGWVIALLIGFSTWKAISSGILNNLVPKTPATYQALSGSAAPVQSTDELLKDATSKMQQVIKTENDTNATTAEKAQAPGLISLAITEYKQVTELDPSNMQAWASLAAINQILGATLGSNSQNPDQTMFYNESANAYYNLGQIYIQKGSKDLAKSAFEAALKIVPASNQTLKASIQEALANI